MDFYAVSPRLREPDLFLQAFEHTVELADAHGFRGILLFDGGSVPFSPWVLAQHILTRTASLLPLIAAGPAYVSAEDAARLIANLHRLYGRPVAINLVAGAERPRRPGGPQAQTGSHSDRYQALQEFCLTLDARLERPSDGSSLATEGPVATRFVAGHSADAGNLAIKLGASNLRMLSSTLSSDVPAGCGLNFGVVTRPTVAEAWAAANDLFPHQANTARVASRVAAMTDSQWKAEVLSEAVAAPGYWRVPAQSLGSDSPFYVGSYDEVARLFAELRSAGVSAVLLDLPPSDAEYAHLSRAFDVFADPPRTNATRG
jgi:alkanesulfonate monooxygenase